MTLFGSQFMIFVDDYFETTMNLINSLFLSPSLRLLSSLVSDTEHDNAC